MKAMLRVGLIIVIGGIVLMPIFAISQKYVPDWITPLMYYGIALILATGFFMRWKKWRLSKKGIMVELYDVELFTAVESIYVLAIALVPAFIFLGFFSLLSTLR
jgi:hypothetical protein